MSNRYPPAICKQNDILRAELGENPRYAWRWSEDLLHVLEVLALDGLPIYVEEFQKRRDPKTGRFCKVIARMVPKTATRKLLPEHHDQWVVCALVEVGVRDGSLQGTGVASWVPLSSAGGVVCLPENETPSKVFTDSVISAVREHRSKSLYEHGTDWEAQQAKKEKDNWNRIYDEIRNESTAYANAPGKRGHVSFPSHIN